MCYVCHSIFHTAVVSEYWAETLLAEACRIPTCAKSTLKVYWVYLNEFPPPNLKKIERKSRMNSLEAVHPILTKYTLYTDHADKNIFSDI